MSTQAESGLDKIFEIRQSSIQGRGIFALAKIPQGAIICSFQGERLTIPELQQKYESGNERIDDPFQVDDDSYLHLAEPYVFFNHSCTPDAGVKGSGTLFALRDISKGEEITYDYSTTEWTDDEAWGINWTDLWKIPCNCKSKNCRKEIRGFPLLPLAIKESYRSQGALMDFILRKL